MATERDSSNITPIMTAAAESSKVQRRSVAKRPTFKRMIYIFAFSDDEEDLLNYIDRSMGRLFRSCYRLGHRTSRHFVTHYSGPRRHESDWCITLADNLSSDAVKPPLSEIIDRMKENLRIKKDPQYYRFYGD